MRSLQIWRGKRLVHVDSRAPANKSLRISNATSTKQKECGDRSIRLRRAALARAMRPVLWFAMLHLLLRRRVVARFSDHLAPFAVTESYPQYSMGLMDAECLLDMLDGSCDFPRLKEQTKAAIAWTEAQCEGPFSGSLVGSKRIDGKDGVYFIPILNDAQMAAPWPTTALLIAYCRMNDGAYREKVRSVVD